MNLILLEQHELDADGLAVLTDYRADHIRLVLKAESGRELRVGIVNGPKGTATVDVLDQNKAVLRCVLDQNIPPRPNVDVLLALPRPKVMKRLWAQLSALGVGRIILTNASKVERNYFDTHLLKSEFYRLRLLEGLQQAGDTRLPEVTIHKRFRVLIEDELNGLFPEGIRLVAHPGANGTVHDAVGNDAGRILLAAGPEGGWTDYEIALLEHHRFQPVSMGPRTLRTDTACVALLALAHDAIHC